MLAIAATSCCLVLIDTIWDQFSLLENSEREYYGISWFPGDSRLVTSHSHLDNNSLRDLSSYALSEVGTIRVGGGRLDAYALSQPHQLAAGHDGLIYATNTGRNCVAVIDPGRGWVRELRLSGAHWDRLSPRETPGNHLNSVHVGREALWVLAHNFGRESVAARFSLPGLVLEERVACRGAGGAHNIWPAAPGMLIGCASEAASLVDFVSGETLWRSPTGGYTRGLAASEDHILLGESERGGRAARARSSGCVWLLDRRDYSTLACFRLGRLGPVHEVRLLDVPDLAHHGAPFAGTAALAAMARPRAAAPVEEEDDAVPAEAGMALVRRLLRRMHLAS